MKSMSFRTIFSKTVESNDTSDFKTRSYNKNKVVLEHVIETALSPANGFTFVHKSSEYDEYMFSHKNGDITLTIMKATQSESAIGMFVAAKKRFGFPKRWGNEVYKLIDAEVRRR